MDYKYVIEAMIALATATVSVFGAFVAARAQLKKVPLEVESSKAEIVKQYQTIANTQALENDRLRAEIEKVRDEKDHDVAEVRAEVEALRKALDVRGDIIRTLNEKNATQEHVIVDYQDWIRRLIFQVRSLGQPNVQFRTSYGDVDRQKYGTIGQTGPLNGEKNAQK